MPRQHEEDPNMSYAQIQAQLHEMSGSIGRFGGIIETMTTVWQHQEAAATSGRKVLHDKIDALTTDVHGLKGQVDDLQKDIVTIQPSVDAFREQKLRAEGAKRLRKYLVGVMLTAAGGIGWAIHEVMPFLHRPPPTP